MWAMIYRGIQFYHWCEPYLASKNWIYPIAKVHRYMNFRWQNMLFISKTIFYIFEFRLNELNPFMLFGKYLSLRSIQSYSYSASSILSTQQQKNEKKIVRFHCIYTKCIIFYSYELFAYPPKNIIVVKYFLSGIPNIVTVLLHIYFHKNVISILVV